MYKKACCTCKLKLLFCHSKPIVFLPFSLTSPSSLLKLPNIWTRQRKSLGFLAFNVFFFQMIMYSGGWSILSKSQTHLTTDEWRLRNGDVHYPDLDSASDWFKICSILWENRWSRREMSTVFSGSDTVPWNTVEGSWGRVSLWAWNFFWAFWCLISNIVYLLKHLPHKLPISFSYINPATSFQHLSWRSPWNLRLPFLYLCHYYTEQEFITLETRRVLEPKCVPQLFLGWKAAVSYWPIFSPSPVTVPSVFAKVHSAQVHSRFYSDEWKLGV